MKLAGLAGFALLSFFGFGLAWVGTSTSVTVLALPSQDIMVEEGKLKHEPG